MKRQSTTILLMITIASALAFYGYKYLLPVRSIYISIEGGRTLAGEPDKIGYDEYHFSHRLGKSDTLILSGAGYETDLVPEHVGKYAETFNESIKRTRNLIRTTNPKNESDTFNFNGKDIKIEYLKIEAKDKADFIVTVLKS